MSDLFSKFTRGAKKDKGPELPAKSIAMVDHALKKLEEMDAAFERDFNSWSTKLRQGFREFHSAWDPSDTRLPQSAEGLGMSGLKAGYENQLPSEKAAPKSSGQSHR